jgi:hypothetical protein
VKYGKVWPVQNTSVTKRKTPKTKRKKRKCGLLCSTYQKKTMMGLGYFELGLYLGRACELILFQVWTGSFSFPEIMDRFRFCKTTTASVLAHLPHLSLSPDLHFPSIPQSRTSGQIAKATESISFRYSKLLSLFSFGY